MKHLTPMIFAVVALIFFLAGATAQAQEKAKEKEKENNRKGIGIELAPPVRAKEYMKGRRYALLIGINDYKDPKIPDLTTCENDAKSLHRLLTDSQIGGVDKDAAILLLGKQATTRNIKKALANLRQIPVDSTIFVYFSGHGAKEADEAFWVTYDSEIDALAASGLADREVRAFLARIPSKRVVVMIDACYAAATIKGGKTLANDFSSVLKKFTGKGRAFLMAAGSGEEAIEAKDLKHSVFTHYLLQGLGGKADSNNDGVIVLTELTTYIDEHVAEEARIRGGIQKPVVSLIDVQEPAKFRLSINAARLRQNQLETAEIRTLRRKRLGELKTLALDSKITVEQYRQGEALLEALESDLDRLDQKRLAEYSAVADGTLPTEKLTKALELIGPDPTDSSAVKAPSVPSIPAPTPTIPKPTVPAPTPPKPTIPTPATPDKPKIPPTTTPVPAKPVQTTTTPPVQAPSEAEAAAIKLQSYDEQIALALKTYLPTSSKIKVLHQMRDAHVQLSLPKLKTAYRQKQRKLESLLKDLRPTAAPILALQAEMEGLQSSLSITNSLGMKLAYIPSGTFIMGSPPAEEDRDDDEIQHRVTLSDDFYMGITEVTQAQWKAIMDDNPADNEGDHLPVENVTWEEAVIFCAKLSVKEGKQYKLPSEAQWEYACRAGTTTMFNTGNGAKAGSQSGWNSENSDGKSQQVGRRNPNPWGLYDMHGNVREWCQDRFGAYSQRSVIDPRGKSRGSSRALRGGSWDENPSDSRSANRTEEDQDDNDSEIGFRVILLPSN